jgi:hypothetical protein
MRRWDDPVPLLQVFGERYRNGQLAPRQNAVRARTVEDALCAIGQTFALLGSPDIRKDAFGDIDFRIGRQIRAYKKNLAFKTSQAHPDSYCDLHPGPSIRPHS